MNEAVEPGKEFWFSSEKLIPIPLGTFNFTFEK